MWSYTGSVEGQDSVSAPTAPTLGMHVKRAMAHTCEIFGMSEFSLINDADNQETVKSFV
jgi:hypothetical protein